MSTQYGPDDSWPRHQKQWWNEALAEAHAVGWTLNYIDAPHTFGVVSCPSEDDDTRHSFMVDKTARGGETKSKEARKLVRTCQHASTVTGSKVRVRQEECERLLHEAERLISIADAGLTSAEAQAAAWADLERIETQLETAEANLAEVLRRELEEALQAADDADDAPEPDTIAATLDDAATAVTRSESVATVLKMRKPKLAQPLLNRAQAARVRIADLRDRLGALY
jgi:multidrug resistance efflux pump